MPQPNQARTAQTLAATRLLTGTLALALGLAMTGCAYQGGTTNSEKEPKIQLVWPAAPADPRFRYETQLRNQYDIRPLTEDERLKQMLTGPSSKPGEPAYRKPSALAARNGRIYVADPPTNSIVVFDVPRGRVFQIGVREPNNVTSPTSLAIDGENNVYVLDAKRHQVMVYDSLGLFMYAVGNPKELSKPSGVAVSDDGQKIFIVDRGTVDGNDHKVIAYSPDNRELFRIGPRGSAPGRVSIPLAATVTRGSLLVLDSGNFRVQTFDLEGNFKGMFGSVGNGIGQFSRPRSISADQDGNIYVSDASFNNVQIFSPAGELLMWLGEPSLRNVPGQFGLIAGIAVDETGRLYVADQYHLKVEVYRPEKPQ